MQTRPALWWRIRYGIRQARQRASAVAEARERQGWQESDGRALGPLPFATPRPPEGYQALIGEELPSHPRQGHPEWQLQFLLVFLFLTLMGYCLGLLVLGILLVHLTTSGR